MVECLPHFTYYCWIWIFWFSQTFPFVLLTCSKNLNVSDVHISLLLPREHAITELRVKITT